MLNDEAIALGIPAKALHCAVLTSFDPLQRRVPVLYKIAQTLSQSGSVYPEYAQALQGVRNHLLENRGFERVLISLDGERHNMFQGLDFCRAVMARLESAPADLIPHRVFDLVWGRRCLQRNRRVWS